MRFSGAVRQISQLNLFELQTIPISAFVGYVSYSAAASSIKVKDPSGNSRAVRKPARLIVILNGDPKWEGISDINYNHMSPNRAGFAAPPHARGTNRAAQHFGWGGKSTWEIIRMSRASSANNCDSPCGDKTPPNGSKGPTQNAR